MKTETYAIDIRIRENIGMNYVNVYRYYLQPYDCIQDKAPSVTAKPWNHVSIL